MKKNLLSFIHEVQQSLTDFCAWREEEKQQTIVMGCYFGKVLEE